jgi:NAD-dependent DNA ligase
VARCSGGLFCPAQRKQALLHFAGRRAMDIEGLGSEIVDALVEQCLVTDVAALFTLRPEQLIGLPLPGGATLQKLSVTNLLASINSARSRPLSKLIFGLGIPHVGEATAKSLAEFFGSIDSLMRTSEWTAVLVQDVGVKGAAAIHSFVKEDHNRSVIKRLQEADVRAEPPESRAAPIPLIDLLKAMKRVDMELTSRNGGGSRLVGIGLESLSRVADDLETSERLLEGACGGPNEPAVLRLREFVRSTTWSKTIEELRSLGLLSSGATGSTPQRKPLSEKLRRTLRAKSPFSSAEIDRLSEQEGWEWVYSQAAPSRSKSKRAEVCFTGFSADERKELEATAEAMGIRPVGSVTRGLLFLVAGENAGPSKLQKAETQGTPVLTREQFVRFANTGEINQTRAS